MLGLLNKSDNDLKKLNDELWEQYIQIRGRSAIPLEDDNPKSRAIRYKKMKKIDQKRYYISRILSSRKLDDTMTVFFLIYDGSACNDSEVVFTSLNKKEALEYLIFDDEAKRIDWYYLGEQPK